MTNGVLPDLHELWDDNDPGATEARFRELLPDVRANGTADEIGQLLTQLARARGLQDDFDGAHILLDEADCVLGPECTIGRIRSLLERGRTLNSSRRRAESREPFFRAFVRAYQAEADAYAIDALHMLGIVTEPDEAIEWNELAMAMAERSSDERARQWLASLYQNQGYTYLEREALDKAMSCFERMLAFSLANDRTDRARIARWFIGRTQRARGELETALAMQLDLLAEYEAAGETESGYTAEEIAECLWALDRHADAQPHFAAAHEKLSAIAWLAREEPERIEGLRVRGGAGA